MTVEWARDVAIIFLAIEALVVTLLLGLVVILLWRLINMLQREIKPVLSSLQETASTVRGTTEFVSDNVVSPFIRASSLFSGAGAALRALLSHSRSTRKT